MSKKQAKNNNSQSANMAKGEKANVFKIISPSFVLIIICVIISAALAGTNALTAERTAELAEKTERETMKELIPAEKYTEKSVKFDGREYTYFEAEDGGELKGYIITTASGGYGGSVSVMSAVGTDGKIIQIEVLDASSETPGLGQNTQKPDFKNQFKGKSGGNLTVGKQGADADIDAVTSATITSKAVTTAVNTASRVIETAKGAQS